MTSEPEDILQSTASAAAKAQQETFFRTFRDYGLLLNTLTPDQLASEIGTHFPNCYQAAIVTTLMARLIAVERRLGAEED